jgi:hypothetical protein
MCATRHYSVFDETLVALGIGEHQESFWCWFGCHGRSLAQAADS